MRENKPTPKPNGILIYRRRMGYTQARVARLLGQSSSAMVSRYERGNSVPPLATALALEIILRVPVAFLFPRLYEQIRSRVRADEEVLDGRGQQDLFRQPL